MSIDFYFKLTIQVESNNLLQSVSNTAIEKFHCSGIEEFSIDEERVDEILGERAYSGGDIPDSVLKEVDEKSQNSKFHLYFENVEEVPAEFLEYLVTEKIIYSIKKDKIRDWNNEWKKGFVAILISETLTIVPEWEKENFQNKEDCVFIYPGMGFGTGTHETTKLCLQIFTDIIKNKPIKSVLDFGCGSGILGIAAIRKTNASIDFCDIDANALDNTVKNLSINFGESDLSNHSVVSRNRFKQSQKYDLIFANILESILELESELIRDSIEDNGYLIVSGLLNDQVDNIVKKYEQLGFVLKETRDLNDWSAILFQMD
jgi:ribosomal protein L11 methyltransferase